MAPKKQSTGRQALAEVPDKANLAPIFDLNTIMPAPAAGKKRKSDESTPSNVNLDEIDCEGMMIDQDPDQVRRKIRRFLDSGEMKVGEFCNAIRVSNNSLNRFLSQSGKTKGSGSDAFIGAWEFFKKREIAGLKMPSKKQKTSPKEGGTTLKQANTAKSAEKTASISIDGIYVPGEETGEVPVQESCDEIRRKISLHLKKPGVTQAQFCRDITAQLSPTGRSTKIQASQLDRFRSHKGAYAGNTSSVYYGAYVFFEKMRIAEGKSKSKHRQDMEKIWPGGMDTERRRDHFLCPKGTRPVMDKYGLVTMH